VTTPEILLSSVVAETITVTAETPMLTARIYNQRQRRGGRGSDIVVQRQASEILFNDLQGAVTSGVKPLPVEIPTSGKVLQLAGALPPEDVWVTVYVRKR
jgi:hypothetical protein